mgnify:CR=1 FL=1
MNFKELKIQAITFFLILHQKLIMALNRTFIMIKPDAVKKGYIGVILNKITASDFKIVSIKMTQLSKREPEIFYSIHKDRPFFNDLIAFMSSGPIVAAVLEKENAVDDFRTLLGATNPEEAAEGTIRKLFANSVGENAVHGSDSDENSLIETQFHFSQSEIFSEI